MMPVYTQDYDFTITVPNDIRVNDPNPFVEPVVASADADTRNPITLYLDIPSTLPDGQIENYKRQYYKNLFSAPTTAGYTQMIQERFRTAFGVIYGYQYGVPSV
jgi:hypothetical protein